MSSPRLIQVIKQDHRAISSLHEPHQFPELALRLFVHAWAEERVLHPLYIAHLEDGKQIAEKDKEEHEALRDRLLQLAPGGAFGPGSPEHTARLAELINSVGAHFTEEERDELPRLENAISEPVSTTAATEFLRLLATKPPFPTLTDLLSTPTDKIKAELSKSLSVNGSERALKATVETKN